MTSQRGDDTSVGGGELTQWGADMSPGGGGSILTCDLTSNGVGGRVDKQEGSQSCDQA